MIADAIRKAETEPVIYFLLTAYIERVRSRDPAQSLPEHIMRLPLRSVPEVRMRFEKLVAELDVASRQLDDTACVAIREALHIFGAALGRLGALDGGVRGRAVADRGNDVRVNAPIPDAAGAGFDARDLDKL